MVKFVVSINFLYQSGTVIKVDKLDQNKLLA